MIGNYTLNEVGGVVGSAAGKVGQAASLSKTPGYYLATANDPFPLGDMDFTLAFWFRPTSRPVGGDYHGLVWYAPWSGGFRVAINNDMQVFGQLSNGYKQPLGSNIHSQQSNLALNAWHFVLFAFDAVNDVESMQVDMGTVTSDVWANEIAPAAESKPLRVGNWGQYSTLDGQIDQLGFWKSAPGGGGLLSTADRAWLWNDGAGRSYADILAAAASKRSRTRRFISASKNNR